MTDEIRIYYESLEQAAHFIKPIIEKSMSKYKLNVDLRLVKLKGSHSYYSKKVAPIIYWKDPDVLITIVVNKEEYPLLMIEFSNAVFTEDHELQRFDGMVAGAENNCIYAKISPITKQSQRQHGGNVDFDYIGPFSLIYKKFGRMFYHFDWKCDDKGIVCIDDNYLSCPIEIKEFNNFIDCLIKFIAQNKYTEDNWISEFEKGLLKDNFFQEWKDKLEKFNLPDIKNLNSSRTEWINSSKEFVLKLNRFGHAMDPERGMLSYYGTFYDKTVSKMLFNDQNDAWYKDTPKEEEIRKYIDENGLESEYDFLYCFFLGSGLYNNDDFKEIVSNYEDDDRDLIEIDLNDFLTKNYNSLNKALRTIFRYSNYFFIVDRNNNMKVKFTWDTVEDGKDISDLPDVTSIKDREVFDEDDVTYITVHNVLKQNGYKIIAVSYPGAQADRVVLVEPGTGRKQKRRYIDIISYLPDKYTNLQENKGRYSRNQIQKEINELAKYKTEDSYKESIESFIDRFDDNAPKIIKIGVGFWANTRFTVASLQELNIENLDYFVYITSNRTEWHVWSTVNGNMFSKGKGEVVVPKTYEIIKEDPNRPQPLDNFL